MVLNHGRRAPPRKVDEDEGRAMAEMGPVEMIVVEFDGYRFKGEIWPELERLKENDIIRLIDLLVLRRTGRARSP